MDKWLVKVKAPAGGNSSSRNREESQPASSYGNEVPNASNEKCSGNDDVHVL
jgi:hypothetical protein